MLAKRLDLERLCRFALTRLDSAEDVYLFHGVARDNPKDERLFVLAEVRDLTPVPTRRGRSVGFPLLERILTEIAGGHPPVPVPPSAGAAAAREPRDPVRAAAVDGAGRLLA